MLENWSYQIIANIPMTNLDFGTLTGIRFLTKSLKD